MPKNYKNRLDFFPLDTKDDDKIEMIKAEHGLLGYAIIIEIWKKAYFENGYFYPWTTRQLKLFCRRENVEIDLCSAVVETALSEGIFDISMYDKFQILTSTGIQKRYFHVCLERKAPEIIADFLLMEPPELHADNKYHSVENPFKIGGNGRSPDSKMESADSKMESGASKTAAVPGAGKAKCNRPKALHSIVQDSTGKESIDLSASADWQTSLYNIIKDSFEGVSGEFDNYGKEGKAIKGLIAKAEKRVEQDQGFAEADAVADFIRELCQAFLYLIEKGNDFWQGQPFLPSILNSSGIHPRVLKQMEMIKTKTDREDRAAEMFKDFKFTFTK